MAALVLVGNANVGKSALFGALTGKYATVSNYPGTTVEVLRGEAQLAGERVEVLDTPGTAGLLPVSEDEQATRDILLQAHGARVLQVCDARNLRRSLLLTVELCEAGVPLVLALNMADEARGSGLQVDAGVLARLLGVPVATTVAVRREGLPALRDALSEARPATFCVRYPAPVEDAIAGLTPLLPARAGLAPRALALLLLAGDADLLRAHDDLAHAWQAGRIDDQLRAAPRDLRALIANARLEAVEALCARAVHRVRERPASVRARLSALTTHPVWGVPILAAVLFACYAFVGVLGAKTAVDFLESKVFGEWITPACARLLALLPAGGVRELLAGDKGIIIGKYGLISMGLAYGLAIVLPIVATFFLAFSVLEDSGYLPRLSVMLDRVFRKMGLNGKAVLPMVLGLGCDTMATMTARILETKKERVLATLLLALAIPCSSQLAVISALLAGVSAGAAAFFFGAVLAVIFSVGWLAAKVIPGQASDFILELPPLRRPLAGNVLVKTVARIQWYLREALPLFLLGTLLVWALDRTGALHAIERACAPAVVGLLGLPEDAAGALLLGFLRRDYAAAGLFARWLPAMRAGALSPLDEVQIVTALVVVTLFVPCIANVFVIVKERGAKTAAGMLAFIFPTAFAAGALVNFAMRRLWL